MAVLRCEQERGHSVFLPQWQSHSIKQLNSSFRTTYLDRVIDIRTTFDALDDTLGVAFFDCIPKFIALSTANGQKQLYQRCFPHLPLDAQHPMHVRNRCAKLTHRKQSQQRVAWQQHLNRWSRLFLSSNAPPAVSTEQKTWTLPESDCDAEQCAVERWTSQGKSPARTSENDPAEF